MNPLHRNRLLGTLSVVLFVLPLLWLSCVLWPYAASWLTGISVRDIPAISPDTYQNGFLASLFVSWNALVSFVLSMLYRGQFKEGETRGWSRSFLLFCLFFLGACLVSSNIH